MLAVFVFVSIVKGLKPVKSNFIASPDADPNNFRVTSQNEEKVRSIVKGAIKKHDRDVHDITI